MEKKNDEEETGVGDEKEGRREKKERKRTGKGNGRHTQKQRKYKRDSQEEASRGGRPET